MTTLSTIEFFFDPACPWTWMTSRWLVDATAGTGVRIEWRNLSLLVVNENKEIPEQYRPALEAARGAHRIIAALRSDDRNDLIGDFYTEWGRRFHHDHVVPVPSMAKEIATAVGARRVGTRSRRRHRGTRTWRRRRERGKQLAGGSDVGSPVIALGEPRVGIFGPIVSPPPTGDDAVKLLDHVVATMTMPGSTSSSGDEDGPAAR